MLRIKQWRRRALLRVLKLSSTSTRLNRVFYSAFSGAFRREQLAVAYGRWRYEQDNESSQSSHYMLRRNVHRIEKGLIMRPRRSVFATEYIEDTVHCYAHRQADALAGVAAGDEQELKWASDVLTAYFEVVGDHPATSSARERFQPIRNESGRVLAPYRRDLAAPPSVRYEDLLELAERRRSVRWFLPKPVPRALVDQALTVAALSPSACNRQPFHFRIFDDPELVEKVAALPLGTAGFNHNFPVVVVVVGNLRAYFHEKDRHVIYIDGSLASMSFVLALETLGLSSCCINWPDIEPQETKMANLLGLEPDQRVVMLIAVGYPDPEAMVPASGKKTLDTLRSYNEL